ncbi:MAG: tetratricopeptide repeat protein, partial [Terriglobales bacterium]
WEKSLPAARQAHQLNPDESIAFVALAVAYVGLGRFDEAKATIDQGMAQKLDVPNFHRLLYSLAFVQNNPPAMERELSILASKCPEATAISYGLAAGTEAYGGRMEKARGFFERSRAAFEANHTNEAAAEVLALLAMSEAAVGDALGARKNAEAALAINSSVHVKMNVANAFARAGDAGRAEALAAEIARERPSDTLANGYEIPTIRATLAIHSNNPAKAVELLQPVIGYDLSSSRAMGSTYTRGNAYLALHKGSEAAAEFQKIVDQPGVVLNAMTGALAKLGLARAYALEGDAAKARVAYQDFFALWKDADPGVPILAAAKSEYAKLQ